MCLCMKKALTEFKGLHQYLLVDVGVVQNCFFYFSVFLLFKN